MKNKKDTMMIQIMVGAGSFLLAFLLQAAARRIPGFAEWYTHHIYSLIVGIYGRICGIFPFSVVELGLYGGVIGVVWYTITHVRQWKKVLALLFCFVGVLVCMFTVNCGVNYYRVPFSGYLELEVRESSKAELAALCQELVEKVNTAAELAESEREPADPVKNGSASAELTETGSDLGYFGQFAVAKTGQKAMMQLGEIYEQLGGYYPRPKPVLWSWILAVQQLCGIYSPFTVEANYNWQMTGYNIPHTICHELSHLKGFMREDEANFIGYLACIGSEDAFFRYSGYLTGWVYAGNALAGQDWEMFVELRSQLCPQAVLDLQANNDYWDRYEGKVAEVSNQVNDSYLKFHDQEDGVKSYGRMVDLMLAYRRENGL